MKLLKTNQDHQKAVQRLSELMDIDPEPGSTEDEQLELLAFLIETYEKEQYAIGLPDPIEAIRFCMEQQGLKQRDLIPYIGSPGKVSEVLSAKRPLSLSMIRKLKQGLGIPADILLQVPKAEIPDELDARRFPFNEMYQRGWFNFSGTLKEAKQRAEELLQDFLSLGLSSPSALLRQLTREKGSVDENALEAWKIRALTLAARQRDVPPFDSNLIDEGTIAHLTHLSVHRNGCRLAVEFLKSKGVRVVIEPRLPKTHLDGAALYLSETKPVIGLTLRHNRLDNFWFCLFHELGHILLHAKTGNILDEDIDQEKSSRIETEADQFALDAFITRSEWKGLSRILKTKESILQEANRRNISPAVIAGRIRWETGNHRKYSHLVGHSAVWSQFGFEDNSWPN